MTTASLTSNANIKVSFIISVLPWIGCGLYQSKSVSCLTGLIRTYIIFGAEFGLSWHVFVSLFSTVRTIPLFLQFQAFRPIGRNEGFDDRNCTIACGTSEMEKPLSQRPQLLCFVSNCPPKKFERLLVGNRGVLKITD